MINQEQPQTPVFVVGMNGSGTSMLTECLGRHPALYAFPGETRMIPHLIREQSRFGDLTVDDNFRALWEYINHSIPDFLIFNNHEPLALPDDWETCPRNLAAVLDRIFRNFAAVRGKSRWCEKSPNHSEHIEALANLFPGAHFVHIIRDGRDCAASTNRRQYRNPDLAIYRWRLIVAEARRQGKRQGDRYFELKYEDLTEDPRSWMQSVCQFLGLAFDERVLQSAMPQSAKKDALSDGEVGVIEKNSKKYRQYFSPAQLRRLENISGKFLQEIGYETEYAAGNRSIGTLRAKAIRAVDFVRGNPYLRRKLAGDPKITWRRVYQQALASIREYSAKRH